MVFEKSGFSKSLFNAKEGRVILERVYLLSYSMYLLP